MDEQLEALVAAVLSGSKYRHVSPEFVRAIGSRELAVRPSLKAAIKATKVKADVSGQHGQTKAFQDDEAAEFLFEGDIE